LLAPRLELLKGVALPLNDNNTQQHHLWGPTKLKKLISKGCQKQMDFGKK